MAADEAGSLSPLFLLLMVSLASATFLFTQVGHASVLASGAETAADAAALAGADNLRSQAIDYWTPIDAGAVCDAARDYADRNDATLVDCDTSVTELAVVVKVRGNTRMVDGPMEADNDDRAVRSAKAGVTRDQPGKGVAWPHMVVRLLPLDETNDPGMPPPGDGTPMPGDGILRPVDGPITSSYGMRQHPITGEYKLHDGTDFGVACGTPIRASQSGMITEQYFNTGYGNRVIVEHGSIDGKQVTTTYNHLSSFALSAGTTVERGQVIGYVGSTGYSTGCHLHWMLLVNGATVDPMSWVD